MSTNAIQPFPCIRHLIAIAKKPTSSTIIKTARVALASLLYIPALIVDLIIHFPIKFWQAHQLHQQTLSETEPLLLQTDKDFIWQSVQTARNKLGENGWDKLRAFLTNHNQFKPNTIIRFTILNYLSPASPENHAPTLPNLLKSKKEEIDNLLIEYKIENLDQLWTYNCYDENSPALSENLERLNLDLKFICASLRNQLPENLVNNFFREE
ncbi:MAG: hypothetical protein HW387_1057 [Parachlamydiales bacterium]|nr:hypothetical protein [Parachlamydiales bacterium]